MTADINTQKLMDMLGAGNATRVVKSRGMWNEFASDKPTYHYLVEVEAMATVITNVHVYATDADQAEKMALEHAETGIVANCRRGEFEVHGVPFDLNAVQILEREDDR